MPAERRPPQPERDEREGRPHEEAPEREESGEAEADGERGDERRRDEEAHLSWAEATWNALRAASGTMEGFYPGFPGFLTGDERARWAYGNNLDRLAAIKARYDPENLLHNNLNVTPAA